MNYNMLEMTPKEYRSIVRKGEWTGHSMNKCRGYAVTDMVILPKEYAYDYLVFSLCGTQGPFP